MNQIINGLNDGAEVLKYGMNRLNSDTDGDGLIDGDELNLLECNEKSHTTKSIGTLQESRCGRR